MNIFNNKNIVKLCTSALVCFFVLFKCIHFGPPSAKDLEKQYNGKSVSGNLKIDYPFDEVVFPPEISSPIVHWTESDPNIDSWLIIIRLREPKQSLSFIAGTTSWQPDKSQWELIKSSSQNHPAYMVIAGYRSSFFGYTRFVSSDSIMFTTSLDSVGSPIFYREVNLPFIDAVKDPRRIQWCFGTIDSREHPRIVLKNLPVCGNCHSFSDDGSLLGMDVDYANDKGSYALVDVKSHMELNRENIFSWSTYQRETDNVNPTYGLLSQVSPDGKHVASTVKDRSVFVPKPQLAFSQLFFPVKGILCIYSRETKKFRSLPGASDTSYVQSNPEWSPDGEHIVFARSKAYDLKRAGDKVLLTADDCREFLEEGKKFLFDLYRVPFNNGKGGKAVPIEGASHNGMSNFFAKYSPNGKWIVFCKASSYMLLQPDSRLYIMPSKGGIAREMNCNLSRMNSWHSWSPNGKWLVFSSKQRSDYTQLFLAHIDEYGRSSRPVLLHQFTEPDRAANIPEFVNCHSDSIMKITQKFVDDYSYHRAGDALLIDGDSAMAIDAYYSALSFNPNSVELLFKLGDISQHRGQTNQAVDYYVRALQLDSGMVKAHANLGVILEKMGRMDEAISHYRKALRLDPTLIKVYNNISIALQKQQKYPEAIEYAKKAIELEPGYALGHYTLAVAFEQSGNKQEAALHYEAAMRLDNRFAYLQKKIIALKN